MPEKIKVFISYKHGKEDHQNWVKKLADDLSAVYGIDSHLDGRKDYRVPYVKEKWAEPYNWHENNRTFPESMENHPVVLVSYYDAAEFCK